MTYRPTVDFLLYDWLNVLSLNQRPRFADHSHQTSNAVFAPLGTLHLTNAAELS